MNKYTNFEAYLEDVHATLYSGLDDEMGDDFSNWLADLDCEQLMTYADCYGEIKFLEGHNA